MFRQYLFPYMPQRKFSPVHNPQLTFGALPGKDRHLEQSTIILAFKMVQNGLCCPKLRIDPMTGKVFSPFAIYFILRASLLYLKDSMNPSVKCNCCFQMSLQKPISVVNSLRE